MAGLFGRHEAAVQGYIVIDGGGPAFAGRVDAVNDLLGTVEAAAAAGAVAKGEIDLLGAADARLRNLADLCVTVAIAQANVHSGLPH